MITALFICIVVLFMSIFLDDSPLGEITPYTGLASFFGIVGLAIAQVIIIINS